MIYFDNAATTFPKPEEVYSFADRFYREFGVNVGRGQHMLAEKASMLVSETRSLILDLFNCPNKCVILQPSATESLNLILQGIEWKEGSNVYISPFEHNAVLRVLNFLKNKFKINIIELKVDKETMQYDLEKISYQFKQAMPEVVVISHASNVCGIIAPVKEIFVIAKEYNAITILDMAQTAGLIETDLNSLQVDYAVFAGHKTLYAPFGIAGIVTNKSVELNPIIFGGTGIDSSNLSMPKDAPERFEAGSQNTYAIAGLNASLKWIKKIGIATIAKKENENIKNLKNVITKFENIKIIGDSKGKESIGILSCKFDDYSSDNIGRVLNENGIAVRTGLHCAPNAHKFLGTFPEGTVRFSVGYFNSTQDFEILKEVLNEIQINS
jgi:cysteine desulfurase family protein